MELDKRIFFFIVVAMVLSAGCISRAKKPLDEQIKLPVGKEVERASYFVVPLWSIEKKKWGYYSPENDSLLIPYKFDHAGTVQNGIALASIINSNQNQEEFYTVLVKEDSIILQPSHLITLGPRGVPVCVYRVGESLLRISEKPGVESFFSLGGEHLGDLPFDSSSEIKVLGTKFILWLSHDSIVVKNLQLESLFSLSNADYSIDDWQWINLDNEGFSNSLVINHRKEKKSAIVLLGKPQELKFQWDSAIQPTKDSFFVAAKDGRNYLVRWEDEIIKALPDSTVASAFWTSFSNEAASLVVADTTWGGTGDFSIFHFQTGESYLIPKANILHRLSDSVFYALRKGRINLVDSKGTSLAKMLGNQIEAIEAQLTNKSNGYSIWTLEETFSRKSGLVNATGSIIIHPSFDKIDIGRSPWHFDFPYVVASRDSGSFHEVFLFGIQGDTVAGPMRLQRWSRGSAYGPFSYNFHVLNHSDWRGTPKEEMLFYIEWEDADSVLHKGYIDFFGHLYE